MEIDDLKMIIDMFEIGKIYKISSLKPKKQRIYKIEFSRRKSPMVVEKELFNKYRISRYKTMYEGEEE